MNNYIELISCPICSCVDNKPFSFEDVLFDGKKYKLGVNKCKRCNLVYTSPRLNSYGLEKLYNEGYITNTVSGVYSTAFETSASKHLSFKKYVYKFLPHGGRMLDIGCGVGIFLSQFIGDDRYVTEGIEFSQYAGNKTIEKGIKVHLGNPVELHLPKEKYDLVSMLYVLEHVPNPMEVLKEIYRLLKPGGYCLIGVPNYNYLKLVYTSPMSLILFKKRTYLHAEEHLQNFTTSTLAYVVKKAGFSIVEWGCALPSNVGSSYVKIAKKVLSLGVQALFRVGIHLGGIHLVVRKDINNNDEFETII